MDRMSSAPRSPGIGARCRQSPVQRRRGRGLIGSRPDSCGAVSRSFKTVARGAGHGVRMSDIADRYDRLAADFASTIAAVPDDAWSSPSPCEGWTARDVVAHLVDNHRLFEGFDLLVHRWDLARAAGLDVTLPADEVARAREAALAMGDAVRGPGGFGPEVPAPEDADDQTRLLAFLGRKA